MAVLVEIEHHLEIDGAPLDLLWVESREALDELGWVRCELTDGAGGPDPAAIIGKKLVLTLGHRGRDQTRTVVGYVTCAERTSARGDAESGTRVVARPRLFRLTQRASSQVFQELSAPDVVKKVLAEGGIPEADQAWQLAGDYAARTYTTQYRETDFAFIERLLSEEGIAFAVDSSSGTDVAVFFDRDLGDIDGETRIPFRLGDGLSAPRDGIGALSQETVTKPGKVYLRDYDFERPKLDIDAEVEADDEAERALEVYVYPGRFTDLSVGERYADVLLDGMRCRRETVHGTTSTLRLHPGRRFTLEEHPYEPLNRAYLVLEVTVSHEARRTSLRRAGTVGHGSRVAFRGIPAAATYRPPRVDRAVAAPGAQVAVVTGPSGSEIHPDAHGRVKVLFPWDRTGQADDTSSLWIRTCQLPLGGGMLTPRTGWEVLLDFIDGDPDQPFVFGRMYNAKTPPPYPLPKNKARMAFQTATTPGGGSTNELRMDDSAGSEEMFMNASKDASISAGNNATESVGNNETRKVGVNHALAVTDSMTSSVGAAQTTTIGANQTVNVGTFMVDDVGSHALSVGGNRDLKAGGDHKRTVTGASTLAVGGMQVDLVAGSVDEETMSTMSDSVGAALVEMTASDRTVTVTGARTEKAGAAKVVLTGGGRSVQVGVTLTQKVAGAILTKIGSDRADSSGGDFMEVAGGAQLIKAVNVVFEATDLLSVVMGASTITLTPGSISVVGTNVTLDGACDELGALVKDN